MRHCIKLLVVNSVFSSKWLKTSYNPHCFDRKQNNVCSLSGCNIPLYHFTNAKAYYNVKAKDTNSKNKIGENKIVIAKNVFQSDARKLQIRLQCTLKEAQKYISDNENIFKNGISSVIDKCKLCEQYGISKNNISKNIWILSHSESELGRKLALFSQLNFRDDAAIVPLLKFNINKAYTITSALRAEAKVEERLKGSNRLTYLATLLQKDEIQITELSSKWNFLCTMKFCKLDAALKLILSYGMHPEYLYNDMWSVRSSYEVLKKRLDILQSVVEPNKLRPWMLHCKDSTLARTIELRDENRLALEPFTSASEYLSNRLEVDDITIRVLKMKHPPLCRVQVHKLKEILDFLFAEGFTSSQICAAPRVLCHSLLTLKERLKLLQSLGYRVQSLMTLCRTKKQFLEFIRKLQHPNSKSNKL